MEIRTRKIEYEYKGSIKRFNLIECDKQITTICEVIESEDGQQLDIEVVSEGMTYEEICEVFPPDANGRRAGLDFCLLDVMRAVIWEAYRDEGTTLEEGNVRHFWYTHIKFLVEDVLRMGETSSVAGAINTAWANLVDSGLVTYEGMNIVSAKENVRRSFIRDSPFSNLLIAVEKENLFEAFEWIPELFNSTLITAGGQPSRSVSRSYAKQLVEELQEAGVDINQDIYMCTISDLDPAGYYIQESFKNQIEKALEYYGSCASVRIRRLFVRPEQITENILRHKAMKCEDVGASNERARKAEDTKWAYFCEQTNGGLYKTEGGQRYRAKVELDAFPMSVIERNILEELLKIIRATSDESLIMIPEIMRIFAKVGKEVVEEIFEHHKEDWLKPIIEAFLSQADELEAWFNTKTEEEREAERSRWHEIIDPIQERYEEERDESNDTAQDEEDDQQEIIDAYKEEQGHDVRLTEIEAEIAALEQERSDINDDIHTACEEQFSEIEAAWERHNERVSDINERERQELEEPNAEHNENMAEIRARGEYRQSKLDEFKRWQEANFNPVDIELREAVNDALEGELDFRYRDIEADGRTQPHVAKLMTDPSALLEDDESAWEQDTFPVFTEKDCLAKAAGAKSHTVEPHRRGFTPDFLSAMKTILHEAGDGVEVDYPDPPEMDDLMDDLERLKEQVESDIDEGKHQQVEDDEDDTESNDTDWDDDTDEEDNE